jgi:hypothetical protein
MNTTAYIIIGILAVLLLVAIVAAYVAASLGGELLNVFVMGVGGPNLLGRKEEKTNYPKLVWSIVGAISGCALVYVAWHFIAKYW